MGCASSQEAPEDKPTVHVEPDKPVPAKPEVPAGPVLAAAVEPVPPKPQTPPPLLPPQPTSSKANGPISAPTDSTHQTASGQHAAARQKERRAAAGSEAVRDHIRKLVVGGPQNKEDKAKVYEVSDSEDDDLDDSDEGIRSILTKPPDLTEAICEAVKKNFVFKGIPEHLLAEVVERMYGVSFRAGAIVLQQDALPKADDCMYFLQTGEAEVLITGAVDQHAAKAGGEEKKVEGNVIRIPQKPGWVFGDIALLFHSPRTASVVAKTNITVWALDRKTFLKFVMKHAQGARALRFLRKLPLLKGLSDNDLIRAASRMPQRIYNDGQALIRYGERGDELYLIRYGKVRVLRPDGAGNRIEVAVLGRGQFIGERAVINDRLRSADCVAQGQVQVVVMKKRDFMDLDNPLLAWMLDYDAVSTVLKALPAFSKLKQEQMEHVLDRFDAREELHSGNIVLNQNDAIEKLYVIKLGDVKLYRNNEEVISDHTFIKEAGGFTFFGDQALETTPKSPFTVVVASETLHLLSLPRRQLDLILAGSGGGLSAPEAVMGALKKSRVLAHMSDVELRSLLELAEERVFNANEVIVPASSTPITKVVLVKAGEVSVVEATGPLPVVKGEIDVQRLRGYEKGRLAPGNIFNDTVLTGEPGAVDVSLVAVTAATTILAFSTADVERVVGARMQTMQSSRAREKPTDPSKPKTKWSDLEFHRIIGTGQFGMVRVVRNLKTNEAYALKAMHKAPIVEVKQIEHVINERKILEEVATHPFCVKLVGSYQDKSCLYLLQEWVAGGELFHHLDLEGAFDEPTAMFYAANVLLALEFLHSKGIVYRDLKPENLLLDTQGYIKMADFGFAKFIGNEKTYTICGTPDYQAPEVIMRRGTTKAADYWALGVLVFEMLVGDPPFKSLTGDPWDTFRRTLSGRFYVPNFISDQAANLIYALLQVNPEKRLGSGKDGANDIKRHKWFSRIDWKALEQKKIPAPIKPRVRNPLDTSNFDNFDNVDDEPPPVPPNRADKHQNWDLWEWLEE